MSGANEDASPPSASRRSSVVAKDIEAESERARISFLVRDILDRNSQVHTFRSKGVHASRYLLNLTNTVAVFDKLGNEKVSDPGCHQLERVVSFDPPNSSSGSRKSLRQQSAQSSSSRPQTVNEIFIGDVFENVIPIKTADEVVPLIRVMNVDIDDRIAFTDSPTTPQMKFAELLNPFKFRRVVNSKPKTPFGFQQFFSESLFEALADPTILHTGKEAKQGYYSILRNAKLDMDDCSGTARSDARRVFAQACILRQIPPLPIIVKCMQSRGTVIDLTGQLIGPEYAYCLAEALEHVNFIKGINLKSNKLDGSSISAIIDGLVHCPISLLVLDKNILKKVGTVLVTRSIIASPEIRECLLELSLCNCKLGDLGFANILATLPKLNNLQKLSVSENDISSKYTKTFGEYLRKSNCPLLYLDLSWNNIRTSGADSIIKSLSSENSRLETLILDWNGLNDDFIGSISKFLSSKNHTMQCLSLRNNLLTIKKMEKISPLSSIAIIYSEYNF